MEIEEVKVGGGAHFNDRGIMLKKANRSSSGERIGPAVHPKRFRHTAVKVYHGKTPQGQACITHKTVTTQAAIYNDKGRVVSEYIRHDRGSLMSGRSKNAASRSASANPAKFLNAQRDTDACIDSPAPSPGHADPTVLYVRHGKTKPIRHRRGR